MAEVMRKGPEHAKTAHGVSSRPPETMKKVRAGTADT